MLGGPRLSITIISGSPGCGKTSLCACLAKMDSLGAHIETDRFFHFIPHRLDPSLPESKSQNEMVVRSYITSAKIFSEGGYSVFLDGVIGPWLFPTILPLRGEFNYVLLHADLEVMQARIESRKGQDSAIPEIAIRMHGQFADIVDNYRKYAICTNNMPTDTLAFQVKDKIEAGKLIYNGS